MKLQIVFKSPDSVELACVEAVDWEIESKHKGLDEHDKKEMFAHEEEKLHKALSKWIKYREYITVEFDTELGTATVIEQ